MKKRPANTKQIVNRRAAHDYELGDTLIVGVSLTGAEVKSLRMGHGHLRGAYVTVKDGELWLLNATINGSSGVQIDESAQTRSRKLLARRREIDKLIEAKQQGKTLVPLALLAQSRFIKLRIAVGKGKKRYDKRQTIKSRDEARAMRAAVKHTIRS